MTTEPNPIGGVLRRTVLKASAVTAGALALSIPVSASGDEEVDTDEKEGSKQGICGDVADIKAHTVIGGGGIDIRVDETGNPDGQPILFVHGFSGSRLVWDRQMRSDLRENFRLAAIDLRGHGNSDKPENEAVYSDSELWAADIQAAIDELGLENPVLVGWSQGSGWIGDYLSVHGDGDIAGVNMVGPRVALQDEDPTAIFGEGFLDLIGRGVFVSTDVEETIPGLEEFILLWTADPAPPKDHVFLFGTVTMVPPYVRAGQLARGDTYDDVLADLESPVLISHGEADKLTLPVGAERIAEIIPDAQISFYPEVGHSPYIEATDRYNQELREFVTGL